VDVLAFSFYSRELWYKAMEEPAQPCKICVIALINPDATVQSSTSTRRPLRKAHTHQI